MKNFLRLIFAALLALGIAACNKEVKPAPVGDNLGKTYVTFTVEFPSTRASSTDETGDSNSDATPEIELGRDRENNIQSVQLVLLECTDGTADRMEDKVVAVSTELPTEINDNQYTVAFKSEDLQAAAGDEPKRIRVIAYCNHRSDLVVGSTLQDAYDEMACPAGESIAHLRNVSGLNHKVYWSTLWFWNDNVHGTGGNFWMTNANRGQWDSAEKLLPSKADLVGHNTIDNAINLGSIEVERTAARIDYADKANQTFTVIKGENAAPLVSVVLTDIGLFNVSHNCYKLRRVSADGTSTDWKLFGKEVPANYVVDTDWASKENLIVDTFPVETQTPNPFDIFNSITDIPRHNPSDWTDQEYSILGYATENTIPESVNQVQEYATGVMFGGYINVASGYYGDNVAPYSDAGDIHSQMERGDPIYVLNRDDRDLMLGSWQNFTWYLGTHEEPNNPFIQQIIAQVQAAYSGEVPIGGGGSVNHDFEMTDEWKAAIKSANLIQYTPDDDGKYRIYYPYYIRHNDNHNPEVTGPMEFAVVRNNVYKIKVDKISGFGDSEPTPPDNPEAVNAYFKVTLTVLPWVVRLNDDIELK